MLSTTLEDWSRATGVGRDTASVHLAGLPYEGHPRRYPLPFALSRLKKKYRGAAAELVRGARDDGSLFVASLDQMPYLEELSDWVDQDPEMKPRAASVRKNFFAALSQSCRGVTAYLADAPRLWHIAIAAPATLPYIVTGDRGALPNWQEYSRALALVHSTAPSPAELELAA
ncbi:hypothetical protein [Thioclava sp. F28-4]|uniref:hypothetical protein n=1 Tax=Thioclava sp. F28-4 TaxID=1915315 RepID=UPI0009981D85|nr:hypothetical protein [Thioclava sp. F28-4]OOY02853.1 hypothetical protein BMI87_20580 [Thioclava sp. F28-4]